ncbi:squalene/phytoene synthase family protein [Streptomyces sp. MI02-7b]|uniref:squalene/phytoene synthase family protein n=1 Tax=Streptomyces sp. MI02-7b TaxID=462941 RepID=UPI0029BE02AC|nr:squalene/phytoene synthase family protein [Streptomyces sp. MI02-7b]MDX3072947.1 squalene/phytoene synthase family protein [Streptomyces sp. MI02-7b]
MTTWRHTLDRAGIDGPALREAYTAQRRLAARFDRATSLGVRLLLPADLVPDVVATTAFMHHTDNLLDRDADGEAAGAAFTAWERRVREALKDGTGGAGDGGSDDELLLRALARTVSRRPVLGEVVTEYLAAAPADAGWRGFATEADFQAYVDAYSLPAFLLVACLLAPPTGYAGYRAACRTFVEAAQRLDFLEDVTEDLRAGRLGIPEDALARHGLTRAGLQHGTGEGDFEGLVHDVAATTRRGLADARRLIDIVPAPHRPMTRALIDLQGHRLRVAERRGVALLTGPARRPVAAALGTLAGAYARTFRRSAGR